MTASEQQTLGFYVPIEEISITGLNPRKDFDEEGLKELASSIGTHGILQPLVCREGKDKKYDLIAGERRLKAAQMVGLKEVPVVVQAYGDDEIQEVMLMENLQREDLKPMEEARTLAALEEAGHDRKEMADRIGMSHSWVSSRIRLLELPEDILKHLEEDRLTVEQAMAFLPYRKWPVINNLEKDLQAHFNPSFGPDRDDISLTDVKRLIRFELNNGKFTQDIDHFGWGDDADMIKREFHKDKECKECKVPIEFDSTKRLCLNSKCWKRKLREAKKVLKERKEKEVDKLAKKGQVDLSKMSHNSYKGMKKNDGYYSPKFDLEPCNGCKDRRTGTDAWNKESTVCVNPTCWNKKQAEVEEEMEAAAGSLQRLLQFNCKRILEGTLEVKDNIWDRVLRLVLEEDVYHDHDGVHHNVLDPYKDIASIPSEELPNVVILLLAADAEERLRYDHDWLEECLLVKWIPEIVDRVGFEEWELSLALEEDKEPTGCPADIPEHERVDDPEGCVEGACHHFHEGFGCTLIPCAGDVLHADGNCAHQDAPANMRCSQLLNPTLEGSCPLDPEPLCRKDPTLVCDPGAFSECETCSVYDTSIVEATPEPAPEEAVE